jgi:hypothetical protein
MTSSNGFAQTTLHFFSEITISSFCETVLSVTPEAAAARLRELSAIHYLARG